MTNKDKNSNNESKESNKVIIEELQVKIKELDGQKSEYLAGWQRERADFLNYKKEEMERIANLLAYQTEELVMKFLPILDNFGFAEKNLKDDFKKDPNVQGLLLIKRQIEEFLKTMGVEEIRATEGKFDPQVHEIVEEVEDKEKESGTIVEEVQKGYKINGRLLRPARVKVVK
jgi:molecular chaperone GrpE